MLTDYFGDIAAGRLGRGRFITLWVVLVAVLICLGLLAGASIGVAEHLVGGDLATARKTLREVLALPAVLGVWAIAALFFFANFNIIAKRARDAGLPGWTTAIVIAALSGAAPRLTGSSVTGGAGFILLVVLMALPGGWVKR